MSIDDRFSLVSSEYRKFDRVTNKVHTRMDLHAMVMLDKLFPNTTPMISATGHDECWLSVTDEEINTLTDDQILELTRCGVVYNTDALVIYT